MYKFPEEDPLLGNPSSDILAGASSRARQNESSSGIQSFGTRRRCLPKCPPKDPCERIRRDNFRKYDNHYIRRCIACNELVSQWDEHHIVYVKKVVYNIGPQRDWVCALCIPCHGDITSRNAKMFPKTFEHRLFVWHQFLNDIQAVIKSVNNFERFKLLIEEVDTCPSL